MVVQVGWRGIASLLFCVVDAGGAEEFQLGRLWGMRDDHPEIARRGWRNVDGLPGDAAMRNLAHAAERHAIVAGFQVFVDRRRQSRPDATIAAVVDAQSLDGLRLREGAKDGARTILLIRLTADSDLSAHFLQGLIIVGKAHCQHTDIVIPAVLFRHGQQDRLLATAFDDGLRPHQPLHRLLGTHPWTTSIAPSRATRHSHLHA